MTQSTSRRSFLRSVGLGTLAAVAAEQWGEAAQAHIDLEGRKTTGQTVLVP